MYTHTHTKQFSFRDTSLIRQVVISSDSRSLLSLHKYSIVEVFTYLLCMCAHARFRLRTALGNQVASSVAMMINDFFVSNNSGSNT